MKFRTHNKIHHMSQALFLHLVDNVKQLSLSPFSLDNIFVYIGRLHWMHICAKNSDDKQILDTIYVRINSYMFFKRILNQPLQEV